MNVFSRLSLPALAFAVSCQLGTQTALGEVPFSIYGPAVDPGDFVMTTFAVDLNFPLGMAELADGSILVGVSNGSTFFGSNTGSLIRLADADADGMAESRTMLFDSVPGGGLTSVRRAGDLIMTTGQGRGKPISIFRVGDTSSDQLTQVGSISLDYGDGPWSHPHSALAGARVADQPGAHDVIFQVGSEVNFAATTRTVSLSSDIGLSGSLAGDAVHMFTITDHGTHVSGSNLRQIASGLRNPAGFVFDPESADLYLQDNGIDGFADVNEPESADELNVIAASNIGSEIEDFGFPTNYIQYRTGRLVGGDAIPPVVAFQPIPDPITGDEAEGPNDIALAPSGFPQALRNGIFVGMHGRFSLGGLANEENPLVFVDLDDGSYFHFIRNDEPAIGHLDGLLSTDDSLFIADVSPGGGFGPSAANTGVIYKITSAPVANLPALEAGDADMDLDFDQFDILRVQKAAKYRTGQSATWGEGDWDGAPGGNPGNPPIGDGVFGQKDIIAALGGGAYLTGRYAAIRPGGVEGDGQTSIIYDARTGEIAVDAPASTDLTSINIDSAARMFTNEPFPCWGDCASDRNIFKATFGSSFGDFSWGNAAQPGLSEDFVANDLSVIGSLAGGGDLGDVDLIYIPEPSSLLLALFGIVGLLKWRR